MNESMYFLFKMGIFQPAMFVYRRATGIDAPKKKLHLRPIPSGSESNEKRRKAHGLVFHYWDVLLVLCNWVISPLCK